MSLHTPDHRQPRQDSDPSGYVQVAEEHVRVRMKVKWRIESIHVIGDAVDARLVDDQRDDRDHGEHKTESHRSHRRTRDTDSGWLQSGHRVSLPRKQGWALLTVTIVRK